MSSQYHEFAHVFASVGSEVPSEEAVRDYSEFNVAAIVPHWLTALSLVATTDAIATCPKRLADRFAQTFRLQTLAIPSAVRYPVTVSIVQREGTSDEAIEWLIEEIRVAAAS